MASNAEKESMSTYLLLKAPMLTTFSLKTIYRNNDVDLKKGCHFDITRLQLLERTSFKKTRVKGAFGALPLV